MAEHEILEYRKCDSCGKPPRVLTIGPWTMFENNCDCGGYVRTDFKKMYEDGLFDKKERRNK